MSNWDLGFGREPADSYEPQYPPQPAGPGGAAFRSGDAEWAGDAGWPGKTGGPGTEDYPGDDDEPYDPPYPVTYERDPLTYERDDFGQGPSWPPAPPSASSPPPAPPPAAPWEEPWLDAPRGARRDDPWRKPESRPVGRRWLIPAGAAVLAAVIGGTLVLLTGGHPSAPASSGTAKPTTSATPAASRPASGRTSARKTAVAAAPPLTLAAAEDVLSGYTTVNNGANAARSDSELAMVETGGSYAIDAGLYTIQRAAGAAPYPAFGPAAATYYLPRAEPGGGPRWFVAAVANAFSANPKKVTSTEYLLFTQAAPGGTWRNAVEPYQLPGGGAPRIAIGGNGLATAVSVTSTSLAAAPDQLAALTAASLDGTEGAVSVPDSADLADRSDQKFWQGKLPTAAVTDAHAPAAGTAGQTFALLTANGGALVFYTDSASLTITPPTGEKLRLTVPGFYSPADPATRVGLAYLDQFAAYDPPPGAGSPTVIAEYSGLTAKN
jgi:hypothetical protein